MEEPTLYVLDTHVLIWYFIGSNRLGQKLKERIDKARRRGGRLLVPTIVLSEALDVAEKGRVELDFAGMYRLIREEPEFEIVGFGPDVFLRKRCESGRFKKFTIGSSWLQPGFMKQGC